VHGRWQTLTPSRLVWAWRHDAVFAAGCSVALAAYNNVAARMPVFERAYVPLNLTAGAALVAAARRRRFSWAELGMTPQTMGAGARLGAAAVGLVAAGYLSALLTPGRVLLYDERIPGTDGAAMAYLALVRIPLGTVVWEEVAFRGVLLAALLRRLPPAAAVGVASAVFGVWHIRPTRDALLINQPDIDPKLGALLISGAVSATALAGAVLGWLRLRSGSLLAPALLHLATNSLGALASAAVRVTGAGRRGAGGAASPP